MSSKYIKNNQLKKKINLIKNKQIKLVFTNGCFDIIHAGHIRYLKKAKSLGDYLIVGINSDSSVQKIKGNTRPINCLKHRLEVLDAISFVDFIVSYETDTPEPLLKIIKPDYLVKGGDYKDLNNVVGKKFVESYGGKVFLMDHVKGVSTSLIIDKI